VTVPLNELFYVTYGSKLDLNKMAHLAKRDGGVNFVGRSSQNHGVSGAIAAPSGVTPFPPGAITVALGGSRLLTSFVQSEAFYTAQNVAVLRERSPMSMTEKLYLCLCIRHNRFRYSAFGREANRTLRTLPVPSREEFPKWLDGLSLEALDRDYSAPIQAANVPQLRVNEWRPIKLSDIFEIKKGRRLTKANARVGDTAFIAAIDSNNGLRQRISARPMHPKGVITVNYNGSVGEAFYQPEPFFASDDVNVLYPNFDMNEFSALFICAVIRREKYRYNYGRKWNLERMKETELRLPVSANGSPDFSFMVEFMRALPYSSGMVLDLDRELALA
jgi:hypothetical protein